ncbi:GAF domain-containing protein [Nocardia arthritidis]|uniref:GAF domain-containing protein n=1 Tax=Nocardia arthritidis TaxID=228602 RepID=A0A6G9YLA3_9NOCA|nr:GAF domain-containing protein [Nocardia arthritidis]QIS13984.1 GAF domain-containing protein [Nocardia arthritidis]
MHSFSELRTLIEQVAPAPLMTILAWIPQQKSLLRVYTTHPNEFPVGAQKPVEVSEGWLAQCIIRGALFLGADRGAMRKLFSDYELIESLGFSAVINLPIRRDSTTVGLIDLLTPEGAYTPDTLATIVRELWVEQNTVADLINSTVHMLVPAHNQYEGDRTV